MQWHWGNIGSMLGGLAALLVTIVTFPQIPGGVRDWRERQRTQATLAEEQREQLALERRAHLYGWSGHGINTYGVTLVTTPEELERAAIELGGYSDYVILRISDQEHGANGNRAESLRQIIKHQGYIARWAYQAAGSPRDADPAHQQLRLVGRWREVTQSLRIPTCHQASSASSAVSSAPGRAQLALRNPGTVNTGVCRGPVARTSNPPRGGGFEGFPPRARGYEIRSSAADRPGVSTRPRGAENPYRLYHFLPGRLRLLGNRPC